MAIRRLSVCMSCYWSDMISHNQIRLLASMNYISIVKIVQAKQGLIEGTRNKCLLEDFVFLHFLQGSKAHSQRGHDKDIMLTIGTGKLECVAKLSYMLATWMVQAEPG